MKIILIIGEGRISTQSLVWEILKNKAKDCDLGMIDNALLKKK